jgi:hypothetical protein
MAVEFVTVRHPDVDVEASVPVSALEHYEERGWSRSDKPSKSKSSRAASAQSTPKES